MAPAVFVERELTARRGRKKSVVRLRIFKPVADTVDWKCGYEIHVDGKPLDKPRYVFGVDGLQALILSFSIVLTMLDRYQEDTGYIFDAWELADIRAVAEANQTYVRRVQQATAKSARRR